MKTQDKILKILIREKLEEAAPYTCEAILDKLAERIFKGMEIHIALAVDVLHCKEPDGDSKDVVKSIEHYIKQITGEIA